MHAHSHSYRHLGGPWLRLQSPLGIKYSGDCAAGCVERSTERVSRRPSMSVNRNDTVPVGGDVVVMSEREDR